MQLRMLFGLSCQHLHRIIRHTRQEKLMDLCLLTVSHCEIASTASRRTSAPSTSNSHLAISLQYRTFYRDSTLICRIAVRKIVSVSPTVLHKMSNVVYYKRREVAQK